MADSPVIPAVRVWTLAELDAQPDPEYQIGGALPARTVGTVFGGTGAGKTFVVVDAALTIASGEREWFGRPVRRGTVVYVAAEAAHSLRNRVRAWRRNHPEADPAFYTIPDAVQLMSPFDVGAIIAAIGKVATAGVALVVFDTWSKVTPGADENSRQDMGIALAGVDRVCKHFDCGALLVHHTGGNPEKSETPRGTTALLASVDWAWLVTEKDGHRAIRCKKMRDGEPFRPIGFRLRPLAPSCVIEPTTPIEALTPHEEDALGALQGHQGAVSATFWQSASGLTRRTFYRTVDGLVQRGLVEKTASGYQVPSANQVPSGAVAPRVRGAKVSTSLEVALGTYPEPGSDEAAERAAIEEEEVVA
jgi:KaiC/GvpD/RAD55 family RecA-like ATPase